MRALDGRVHVVGKSERASRRRGIGFGLFDNVLAQRKLLRVRHGHINAVAGKKQYLRLRHGQRFGVRFGIGPGDRYFQAARLLAEIFKNGHQIRKALHGVIDVVLQRHHRHGGPAGKFVEIGIADAVKAIAAGDAVAHARQNDRRILGRLAVRELHLVRRQVVRVAAELGHARLHRVARARALLKKHHEQGFVRQQPVALSQRKLPF